MRIEFEFFGLQFTLDTTFDSVCVICLLLAVVTLVHGCSESANTNIRDIKEQLQQDPLLDSNDNLIPTPPNAEEERNTL
jgi:hypothetical protein